MTVAILIQEAVEQGVYLYLEDSQLRFKASVEVFPETLKQQIVSNKQDIIEYLALGQASEQKKELPIPSRAQEIIDPALSFSQQRLWFIDQMEQGSAHYNMPVAFDVIGQFDLAAASASLTALVARHEVLRTVYITVEQQGCQRIQPATPVNIAYESLCDLSLDEQGAALEQRIITQASQLFDLTRDLMIRAHFIKLSDHHGTLLFNMHHIASDGWSMGILVKEFIALYRHFAMAEELTLAPLAIQYADYAVWQRNHAAQGHLDAQLDYWTTQLADAPSVHSLPLDKPRPAVKQYQGNVVHGHLDEGVVARLQKTAQDHSMTAFMVLHGALSLVLSRHSYSEDVLIGTPVANRQREELAPLIGFFVNTLVLRVHTGHDKVSDYLAHVKAVHLAGQANQDIPFDQLVDHCQVARSTGHSPLFQIMLTLEQDESYELVLPQVAIRPRSSKQAVAKFDLTINVKLESNGAQIEWLYDKALFSEAHISQLNAHFEGLLAELVSGQAARVNELEMLSAAEQTYLTESLNPQEQRYPSACIHTLFEEQVAQGSTRIALEYQAEQITYGELNARASHVAAVLLNGYQVTPGSLIGICMGRTPDMIVAMLGILKAGCAYVPLDPNYPKARLEEIVQDAKLQVVLSGLEQIQLSGAKNLLLADIEQRSCDASYAQQVSCFPESVAYVNYTSGSTGKPKGVLTPHRGVSRLVVNNHFMKLNSDSHFLHYSSPSFDAATLEIWGPLLNGGRCLLYSAEHIDVVELNAVLQAKDINCIWFTAGLFNEWSKSLPTLPNLKYVLAGGDRLEPQAVRRVKSALANVTLINGYGPTENTTFTTCYEIPDDFNELSVPIGFPVAGTSVYILSCDGKLAPQGAIGELVTGGLGTALGYLNHPELSDEKFIINPFGTGKLYKTGDLARYLSDGAIEFVGRVDHQVKIRGYRIEPAEIEWQLNQDVDIDSACILITEQNEVKQLSAYIKPVEQKSESLAHEFVTQLKMRLSHRLPTHMMPQKFHLLASWPLTPTGKISRAELLQLTPVSLQANGQGELTLLEQKLQIIWGKLLARKISETSVESDFFELGGDSILAIQLVAKAAHDGINFTVKQLYQAQTIRRLSQVVSETGNTLAVIEQGPSLGQQRLLPIQQQFFTDPTDIHHFNQSVMLELNCLITLPKLQSITAAIYQRHDALRLTFSELDGTWSAAYQVLNEQLVAKSLAIIKLPEHDFTELEAAANQVQTSLSIAQGPLFKITLFSNAKGEQRLLIVVHHLVVDGVSWRILLADLALLFQQTEQNKALHLPVKTVSLKEWADSLTLTSNKTTEQTQYWQSLLVHGQASSIKYPFESRGTHADEQHCAIQLDAEYTARLVNQAQQAYNTKITELLLSALSIALKDWSGDEKFIIDLERHGRETTLCEQDTSQTIGWFTSLFPFGLDVADCRVGEVIKKVKQNYRAIPDNGVGYGVLKYLLGESSQNSIDETPRLVVFNYLGQFDQVFNESELFKPAKELAGASVSRRRMLSHGLSFNGMLIDKRLSFNLTYDGVNFTAQQMQRLATCMVQALEAVIDHCCQQKHTQYLPIDFPLSTMTPERLNALSQDYQIQDLYPTSPLQAGLLYQSEVDESAYKTQVLLSLKGQLDTQRFRQAWLDVANKYAILRTVFVDNGHGEFEQLVLKKCDIDWSLIEFNDENRLTDSEIKQYAIESKRVKFDTKQYTQMRFTLWKIDDDNYKLLWTHHHALIDGWCLSSVFGEVSTRYQQLAFDKSELKSPQQDYKSYIEWLSQQDINKAKDYWQKCFSEPVQSLILPSDLESVLINSKNFQSHQLDKVLVEKLQVLAKKHKTTLNILLQAAYGLLLGRHAGLQAVTFATTVSGRPAGLKGVDDMVGLFINTIPVGIKLDGQQRLSEWFTSLHHEQVARDEFNYLSLTDIQNAVGAHNQAPLVNTLLVVENYPVDTMLADKSRSSGLNVADVKYFEEASFDLSLIVSVNNGIGFKFEYNEGKFSKQRIEILLEQLSCILERFTAADADTLKNISILSDSDINRQLYQYQGASVIQTSNELVQTQFEQHARRNPDQIALSYEQQKWSYIELDQAANQLANYLISSGVRPGDIIGICQHRKPELIVTALAVLKAGAAYLPLDPDYPLDRLAYMVSDAGLKRIIGQVELRSKFTTTSVEWLAIDDIIFSADTKALSCSKPELNVSELSAESLAYVVYTSGSTGAPKGSMICHGSLINLAQGQQLGFNLLPESKVLQFASFAFDAAASEIFVTLSSGATLVLVDQQDQKSPQLLSNRVVQHGVTHATLPPALLPVLPKAAWQGVHTLIIAGEACGLELARKWAQGRTLINAYGPSEATVCTTLGEYNNEGELSIGRPIQNVQCYVLDEQMQLLPQGAIGELYIGGAGLSTGYLNNADLTTEKFIANPFYIAGEFGQSQYIYRSGDLVKYLNDGRLVFVGRGDEQVKIRGYRVELGEIAHQLQQHDSVDSALVVNQKSDDGLNELLAYVKPIDDITAQQESFFSTLKSSLGENLPHFMVPGRYVLVDKWPLNANGKIDKPNLPKTEIRITDTRYKAAKTETEIQLVNLCAELLTLPTEKLSVETNFFELGGHSLLLMKLLSKVEQQFQLEANAVPLDKVLQKPTISNIASIIEAITIKHVQLSLKEHLECSEETEEGEI